VPLPTCSQSGFPAVPLNRLTPGTLPCSLESADDQWMIHAPLLIEMDRLLSRLSGPVEE
jgi:hypothetical protein